MVMAAAAGVATAAIGTGGSLLSGSSAQQAATKARRAQETAATQQLEWNKHMWMAEQAQRAPWLEGGERARATLERFANEAQASPNVWQARPGVDPSQYAWTPAGVPDPTQYRYQGPGVPQPGQYGFDQRPYHFQGPAQVDAGQYAYAPERAVQAGEFRYTPTSAEPLGGFTFRPPTVTDDPGYQFRLQQGQAALDASAAARGGLTSGAALRALQTYGQQLGSQEYQAAYGRSWQQQQEQYERQRLMNMTQEERQRYADQANYQRAVTANMTDEERARYANQLGYGRAMEGQERAYTQGLGTMQYNANLDWQTNQAAWQRAMQAQQEQFRQGQVGSEQDWARAWQAQQEQYGRGLTANQLAYGRAVAANETAQARGFQEYAARIAEQERNWGQYATLAGFGQQQQNQLGLLGAQYAQNIGSAYNALGQAQATGAINQANALTNMYSGVASSFNQGLQNSLLTSYLKNQQQPRTSYTGDAPGL